MWKKIRSNRDPRDTLYSELRREYGQYFSAVINWLGKFFKRFPKLVFGTMVILLFVSMVLSFTFLRKRDKKISPPTKTMVTPVKDGFDTIIQTAANIRETLALKHLVDSISEKKQLTSADSLALDSALTRLQHIHNSIK